MSSMPNVLFVCLCVIYGWFLDACHITNWYAKDVRGFYFSNLYLSNLFKIVILIIVDYECWCHNFFLCNLHIWSLHVQFVLWLSWLYIRLPCIDLAYVYVFLKCVSIQTWCISYTCKNTIVHYIIVLDHFSCMYV